ncbi:MAG TPA: DUF2177 family protein [Candidatus Bathyarchaeia archaeon]|nr:DUF2177 family protein [Candidatus Bathyarchaeia archaeon]
MIKKFFLTWAIFIGLDFIWLGFIARNFYDQQLEAFTRTLNWPPAILTYILIPLGIFLFVLPKVSKKQASSFFWGAVFGLIVYGVYDLTNLAILAGWSLAMVVGDILWGMFICGTTSLIVVSITERQK